MMFLEMSYSCIKYSLLFLNILFVISGIIVTCLGVYIKAFYYSYESFVSEQYLYAPDFLIALGAIIFVVAFVGCCGILTENTCMNLTFTTFLVLIFFIEIGLGLAGYIMKEEAHEYLMDTLPNTMTKYNSSAEIRFAWDTIQNQFHCCGVKSYKDWTKNHIEIPNSCYSHLNTSTHSTDVPYDSGCVVAFGKFVMRHSYFIEAAGLGLAMMQLLGIACSCYISNENRKGYETV